MALPRALCPREHHHLRAGDRGVHDHRERRQVDPALEHPDRAAEGCLLTETTGQARRSRRAPLVSTCTIAHRDDRQRTPYTEVCHHLATPTAGGFRLLPLTMLQRAILGTPGSWGVIRALPLTLEAAVRRGKRRALVADRPREQKRRCPDAFVMESGTCERSL